MDTPDAIEHHRDADLQDPQVVEKVAEIADRILAGELIDRDQMKDGDPKVGPILDRLLPAIDLMVAIRGDSEREQGDPGSVNSDSDKAFPRLLGDFQLVRTLGRGGMGIVYEARQLSLGGRRVAVKVLRAATALDPRLVRRFQV